MNSFRICVVLAVFLVTSFPSRSQAPEKIAIDLNARTSPFPHFWEQSFGSGRAILSLRESYRNDLREVKKITDFRYVRFHAIFHDELGVYDEDENGNPDFNFTYIGQVYDGLLQNGVRPFVEISFMPKKLASRQDLHPFWYKQNVAPPKDYAKWDLLIRNFAQFLIDRYGIDEVSQWYFEVWNEPNIDFWSGDPKQATYFELYDHTARALKSVNPRLRVGGPSTSSAHWVDDFLAHVAKEKVPIDFASTHGYSDDTVEDLFGTHDVIPIEQRACKAVELARVLDDRGVAALADRIEDRRDRSLRFRQPHGFAGDEILGLARFEYSDHRIQYLWSRRLACGGLPAALHYNLVQRILHNPLRPRLLQPRDDVSHRALIEDRIHRHPFGIAELRNRGLLERRQHTQHGVQVHPPDVQHQPDLAERVDRAFEQHPDILQLAPLPVVLPRVHVRDQLRVRFEYRLDNPQLIGAQR